ncbi:DUF5723 family protein [Sediminicola arcticus]|jgi:hypothetical protein|uniref:DUF5723 family protein n=1 Tax=Sediminicola arcticus TaxID=1574308 RepID=A0ABV2SRM2_9FLAO
MRLQNLIVVFLLLDCSSILAQNKQLLYDFMEVPQALMLNPGARATYQWYGGIPMLSGISAAAGTSGVTVNDIFANDGIDITTKIRDKAIFGMNFRDEISGTIQFEFLNVGFRSKNRPSDFYSFGMYLEEDMITYWPQDLAILGFEGNANYIGSRFNLEHLKVRGEVVNVFHFGINRKLNNTLRVGVRGKLYSGILDVSSTSNSGYFVTNPGENNLLANTLVADVEVRTSGIDGLVEGNQGVSQTFLKRALLGGDLGLGLDVGFTYRLNNRTLITGSLLDVGFIRHTKDVKNYTLKGSATNEGISIILPGDLEDPNRDFWQELVDEIEELIPFEDNRNSYINFRPTKLNASLRYNFGEPLASEEDCECTSDGGGLKGRQPEYANSVGGQLYMINRPRGPQAAFTAFYMRKLGNFLALKTTYTVDKFSISNIGLGMSMQAGPVELYAMADNLLGYRNVYASQYASFQFGLNIISWGRK